MKRTISILLNLLIFTLSLLSWGSMVFAITDGGMLSMPGWRSLRFFTVLSNLFNAGICLAYAIERIRNRVSERMQIWKLMGTAAVGLTFLTVMGFLGPVYGYGGMFLGGNLWLHLLLPVLSILGYLLMDSDVPISFRKTLWAVAPMLVYAAGYLGNILIQGVGQWPDRHDFYGFLLWGWGPGVGILLALTLVTWLLAMLLWRFGKSRKTKNDFSAAT